MRGTIVFIKGSELFQNKVNLYQNGMSNTVFNTLYYKVYANK